MHFTEDKAYLQSSETDRKQISNLRNGLCWFKRPLRSTLHFPTSTIYLEKKKWLWWNHRKLLSSIWGIFGCFHNWDMVCHVDCEALYRGLMYCNHETWLEKHAIHKHKHIFFLWVRRSQSTFICWTKTFVQQDVFFLMTPKRWKRVHLWCICNPRGEAIFGSDGSSLLESNSEHPQKDISSSNRWFLRAELLVLGHGK